MAIVEITKGKRREREEEIIQDSTLEDLHAYWVGEGRNSKSENRRI